MISEEKLRSQCGVPWTHRYHQNSPSGRQAGLCCISKIILITARKLCSLLSQQSLCFFNSGVSTGLSFWSIVNISEVYSGILCLRSEYVLRNRSEYIICNVWRTDCSAPGSDGLKSPAYSGDGRGRSGSGETQARPRVTRQITAKYAP